MTTISGNPSALRTYSDTTLAQLPGLETRLDTLRTSVSNYNGAPSELPHSVLVPSAAGEVGARLAELDALPAAFAFALRQSDEMGPLIVNTMDEVDFVDLAGMWMDQHVAGSDPTVADQLADSAIADLFSVYSAGGDPGPLKVILGALRVNRTRNYLSFVRAGQLSTTPGSLLGLSRAPSMASAFPTTNTGLVGRLGSQVFPRAAPFINSPLTTATLRWTGIAGGTYGTVTGVMNLVEQGNPIDAYQENGAGYVADVSGTMFSASTTAFLIAPNPITGGAVIITGAVWAGAEIWDHREAIGDWSSDRWDDVTNIAGNVGDFTSDRVDDVTGFAGDRVDDVTGFAGDRVDDLASIGSAVEDKMPWNWG